MEKGMKTLIWFAKIIAGCTIFADNRFVGIFPGENGAAVLDISNEPKDLISGETIDSTNLKPKGAYIFL